MTFAPAFSGSACAVVSPLAIYQSRFGMVASMPLRFSSVKKIRFVVNSFPLASTATSLFAVRCSQSGRGSGCRCCSSRRRRAGKQWQHWYSSMRLFQTPLSSHRITSGFSAATFRHSRYQSPLLLTYPVTRLPLSVITQTLTKAPAAAS